jgi:hypothetical protein
MRAAADLNLRPRGNGDRQLIYVTHGFWGVIYSIILLNLWNIVYSYCLRAEFFASLLKINATGTTRIPRLPRCHVSEEHLFWHEKVLKANLGIRRTPAPFSTREVLTCLCIHQHLHLISHIFNTPTKCIYTILYVYYYQYSPTRFDTYLRHLQGEIFFRTLKTLLQDLIKDKIL